ncbi:hypothetical protein Bhyg_03278 [Pseudolycoriella hygida]|uniref:Uncharacterized protein n=1 Tax=Pseudolycoriella hygida TaxID=35572 RepID=A0A9Q0S8L6_9DIPT|nr:hypothetical protein Bhyg_03278 [Pseudolycoriella hygida]
MEDDSIISINDSYWEEEGTEEMESAFKLTESLVSEGKNVVCNMINVLPLERPVTAAKKKNHFAKMCRTKKTGSGKGNKPGQSRKINYQSNLGTNRW